MTTWKFGLCDLAGAPIGEVLNATERRLTLPLNGLPTASFKLRLDDPLANQISDRDGDCLVKVYQGSTLRFIGDITTVEESGEGESQSLVVNAAGPLWRLQKRLVGISATGATLGYTAIAANTILVEQLTTANTAHDTGIRTGTVDTLYETNAGPWGFKPVAELYADMQSSKVPYPIADPPSVTVQDDFNISHHTVGNLTGAGNTLSLPVGQTWTGFGDADDFQIQSGGTYSDVAYRGAVSDSPSRFEIAGTNSIGSVLVGVDYETNGAPLVGHDWKGGVFARYTDADHLVYLYPNLFDNTLTLTKVNGVGTAGPIGQYTWATGAGLAANTRYSLRLLIDDSGNFTCWNYATATGDIGAPKIWGSNADLASTGALATGQVGMFDGCASASPLDRFYDNFFATPDPVPQSFDFELAPSEPTADTNQSGVVGAGLKIASLNIRTAIGTTKPAAIFEYGTGGRTVKSYRRITDRNGLCNQAYSLGGADNIDVRSSTDFTSITARGLFQEVVTPLDLASDENSLLRQAWADANVNIRKVPRELITFEPSENAPGYGSGATEYLVGDTVTGRAIVNGDVRFNGTSRVYGVDISVDDEGKATITPTLTVE